MMHFGSFFGTYHPSLIVPMPEDDCGCDTCPYEPPCDFHGDGEPEEHDDG